MKSKPLILITNDDGIDSPGLKALAESLLPIANLIIAAPKTQQTGMGRAFLKGRKIGKITKKNLKINNKMITAYAVNGSPAQSVAHAVLELTGQKPDYCVSGINYGENLGLAYTCSGTIGAALEADSLGIKSIAFSKSFPFDKQKSSNYSDLNWETEKYHIRNIVSNIIDKGFPKDVRILNINFPEEISKSTEVRTTKQAYMNYGVYIKPEKRNINKSYKLKWEINPDIKKAKKDTDIYAVHFDKVVSVTPINSKMSLDVKNYYKK
ncbi:MAG: 5'/3'-nucleotidase SurE [Fusobacteriota bacterium]